MATRKVLSAPQAPKPQFKFKSLYGTATDEGIRNSTAFTEQPYIYQRTNILLGIGFFAGLGTSVVGIEF